jgi:NitT/TauT family transport system substrate-binding protein
LNKRKLALWSGVVLLSTTLLASCGSKAVDSKSSEPIKVAYNLWVGSSGVFTAEAKDMFKTNGLNVEMVQFASPTEAVQALISGKVDVSLTTLDTAVMLKSTEDKKNPIKAIHISDLSNGADGIVAKSTISSIPDLKGKKIAVTVGAVNHYLLNYALSKNGLKESDVSLVNMAPELTGSAFLSGSVDAAVTWEPFLSEAKAKGGKLLYSTKEASDVIVDVVVTGQTMLDKRPEDLKKLISSFEMGVDYFNKNKKEGIQIVSKTLETDATEVENMLAGVKLVTMEDSY